MTFTTRPEIAGTFGVVTSTHWIASAVGMKLLEAGGSAADAAAGAGFVLNVVEPHLNGPLGDMPLLVWPAGAEAPGVICGQGSAPQGASIAHYTAQGLSLIPGAGPLATVIPGAFGAWMALLRAHGRLSLRTIMEPAIQYARAGHPLLASAAGMIAAQAEFFARAWPSSAETWTPHGSPPAAGAVFANPTLADFWERLLREAETAQGREAQIEAARRAFYEGFVAEAIDAHIKSGLFDDGSGIARRGVLTAEDMAGWQAHEEPALSIASQGWDIYKPGAWTQGPVLLQSLQMLERQDLAASGPLSTERVHRIVETLKLTMADREAYYGDPAQSEIPLATLLSPDYAAARAGEIGRTASHDQRPGPIPGFEAQAAAFVDRAARFQAAEGAAPGGGEPTFAHLTRPGDLQGTDPQPNNGDTVHIDVIDRWGNMVSATPSGGWLQSNPVVPGLGVPLNSRAQMFWLEEGLATSLAPGRRPRTTLSPSMARRPDGTRLAFGTPGGDQQDQWQLIFLTRLIHDAMGLQEAIDGPLFHSLHLQSSFHPRGVRPGEMMIEPAFPQETLRGLTERGHRLTIAAPWSVGRLTAAARRPDGLMTAAATPRLMQAYAIGR
ncbi:MAG: gamma-glutamyltransferase [Pseudomonadota bacterium]